MDVGSWCGRCGQQFRLVEVLQPGAAGHCPRCGAALSAEYTTVVAAAVRQVTSAAAALATAGRQLAEVAPRLHVDTERLGADLHKALDH